jgi:hypothetical protein
MAVETLKIVLTADNKQAIAGMNETVNSLNKVNDASGKAGGATAKLGTNFTGLSRVIQDLPYGFNAISNNLTQLLPAAGAAGLAFSGIVTALTFAQIGFGAWTRGLGGVTKSTEEATKVNDEYLSGLAKEKTQLQLLYNTAINANIPLNARKDAIKELRDNYGEYLKNFSDEEILAGKAAKAYDLLSSAIIKAAKARAAQSLIEAKQLEVLKLEEENTNALKKAEEDRAKVKGGKKLDVGQTMMSGGGFLKVEISAAQQFGLIQNEQNAIINKNKVAIAELTKEMDELGKTYSDNVVKFKEDKTGATGAVEKINGALENYMNNLKEILPLLDRFNAQNDRLNFGQKGGQQTEMLAPQRNTGTQDLQNLQLQITANNTLNNALAERNSEQMKYEEQLRESQAAALTNNLMNSVNGLFTAMQNGASLGDAFGNMFKQLAIDIALAAAKAAIFQAILSAINPVGGASKAGGFLKGFGKLLGFAEGGTVSGPQSGYPVMLHGTEHIVRPDQMKQIIASASQMGGSGASRVVVEGRIRGNDIFLSQQRTGTFRNLTT